MEVHSLPTETIKDKILSSPSLTTTTTTINTAATSITPIPASQIDTTFSTTTNLTTTVLGATIVSFSDEYFAAADNLLTPTPAIRKAGVYVHSGAWFDGWETRRHNQEPFDWVVVKLGCVGVIEGLEVDTAHFNGNEAPEAGLDGCFLPEGDEYVGKQGFAGWSEVLPKQPCGPSQRQAWKVESEGSRDRQYTHLRLKMYPDGGIARLRVYGRAVPPPLASVAAIEGEKPIEELSSALNGGVALSCSDQHFGVKSNILLPGRGKDMGDGWETARSRTKGHVDWVICRLGLKGKSVYKVVVDTKDFRGNFPRAVKVEGWFGVDDDVAEEPEPDGDGWVELVRGERPCQADTEHVFNAQDLSDLGMPEGKVWTHVKLTIIPDGGVKRLRVFGRRA
jgi:allantoicase